MGSWKMIENEISLQEYHRRLNLLAFEKGIPLSGALELTARCNLRCRMCYIRREISDTCAISEELPGSVWIDLAKQAYDMGALNLIITGGEPLLHPDSREIIQAITKLGFRVTLFTNGTMISKNTARWLSQSRPATIDVTVYGSCPDVYADVTGSREAYALMRHGVDNLMEEGINVRFKTTIIKKNFMDYSNIKKLADELKMELITSALIHDPLPGSASKDVSSERLSPDEMALFDGLLNDECSPADKQQALPTIEQMLERYPQTRNMTCSAGKTAWWLNWQGKLTSCALMYDPYTDPIAVGFSRAWSELREKVNLIEGAQECVGCRHRPFCPVCVGRMRLETGAYDGHSDYICQLAQIKENLYKSVMALNG